LKKVNNIGWFQQAYLSLHIMDQPNLRFLLLLAVWPFREQLTHKFGLRHTFFLSPNIRNLISKHTAKIRAAQEGEPPPPGVYPEHVELDSSPKFDVDKLADNENPALHLRDSLHQAHGCRIWGRQGGGQILPNLLVSYPLLYYLFHDIYHLQLEHLFSIMQAWLSPISFPL